MAFLHKPRVLVRDTPVGVRGLAGRQAGSVRGATIDGRIYLFRDALPTRNEITTTLWHDLVHYGLRRFLSEPEYISTMRGLYERDAWVRAQTDA